MLIALQINANDWSKLPRNLDSPRSPDESQKRVFADHADGYEIGHGRITTKGATVPWTGFFDQLGVAG